MLLSATMPQDVLEVTKRFMRNPINILVKKEELTLEGIKQFYVDVDKEVIFLLNLILILHCIKYKNGLNFYCNNFFLGMET